MLSKRSRMVTAAAGLTATVLAVVTGCGTAAAAGDPGAAEVIEVGTAAELAAALSSVKAGDTIQLADATFDGQFVATVSGTADAPITIAGSRDAILDGGDTGGGYGFHLDGASYVTMKGFTVTNSGKGIMGDAANNNVIDGLLVHHIGDEAIHLRCASSDNVIQNSEITDTGVENPKYGEGVYFGHAKSNWENCDGGGEDHSDRNKAIGNKIGPDVRAEAADLKEGSTGGEIRDNIFDGTGMSGENYADSWIDAKGNDYIISGNKGTNALLDGFQTHQILDGWGTGNVFANNTADVGAEGYGFNIEEKNDGGPANVVCTNNTVTNAGAGDSNIEMTADCPVS